MMQPMGHEEAEQAVAAQRPVRGLSTPSQGGAKQGSGGQLAARRPTRGLSMGVDEEPDDEQLEQNSRLVSGAAAVGGTLFKSFRGAFQVMSDWGDEVERKHFGGDFLGSVNSVPQTAARKLSETMEGIESIDDVRAELSRKVDQVGAKVTRLSGQLSSAVVAQAVDLGSQAVDTEPPTQQSESEPSGRLTQQSESKPSSAPVQQRESKPSGNAALLEQVTELNTKIAAEREANRARSALLSGVDERLQHLRADLVDESAGLAEAEAERREVEGDADFVFKELEELQERHHALLSKKASLEAELRRHSIAADLAERNARQASREGAWARAGPETEALKDAKLALAELLAEIDQARHETRRELSKMQREVDTAAAEFTELQQAVASISVSNSTGPLALFRTLFSQSSNQDAARTSCSD